MCRANRDGWSVCITLYQSYVIYKPFTNMIGKGLRLIGKGFRDDVKGLGWSYSPTHYTARSNSLFLLTGGGGGSTGGGAGGAPPPPNFRLQYTGVPKSPLLSLFCKSVFWLKPHNNVNSRPPNLAVLPPPPPPPLFKH